MLKVALFNLLLRGLTLLAKFALVIGLARILSPYDVGVYGLVAATLSYSLFVLGIDFYTFSTRDMLSRPLEDAPRIIRDQLVFFVFTYIVFLPLLMGVFLAELLPWELAAWFYLLLLFEHLSQELYRLLVALGKSLIASIVMFLRMGAWVILAFVWFYGEPSRHELINVLYFWVVGAIASVCLGGWALRGLNWGGLGGHKIDWAWMRRGVCVAAPLLVGTLANRGIFTFDRYILDVYSGKEAIGVYTVFIGMATALISFVDAGAVVSYYPRIVVSFKEKDMVAFRANLKRLAISIALISSAFIACAFFLIGPLLGLVGKEVYMQNMNVFWLLLLSCVLMAFSYVPHFGLYAMGADRTLIFVSLISLVVFLVAALLWVPEYSLVGLGGGMFVSLGLVFVLKSLLLYRYMHE